MPARGLMSKQECKVFVGGLSWETSDDKLRSGFHPRFLSACCLACAHRPVRCALMVDLGPLSIRRSLCLPAKRLLLPNICTFLQVLL